MVRAHLHTLLFTGIGDIEGRHGAGDGRTPGHYDLIAVSGRDDNLVRLARSHGGKAEQRTRRASNVTITVAEGLGAAVSAASATRLAQAPAPERGVIGTAL